MSILAHLILCSIIIRKGNGNTLQHSCLGNPMDRGSWKVPVHIFLAKKLMAREGTELLSGRAGTWFQRKWSYSLCIIESLPLDFLKARPNVSSPPYFLWHFCSICSVDSPTISWYFISLVFQNTMISKLYKEDTFNWYPIISVVLMYFIHM